MNGTVVEWHRYEYNESNQLISEKLYNGKKTTSLAYTYDADGNRISETGRIGTDKVNKTYEYSVENRLAAVRDGDELLLAAAYDGDGNRVFLLNYNLHTDDDWKGNSGNGNGNNKDNSGSGNKGNGESGLLNNRAGQIFLDYGDVIMGLPVTLPSSLVGIREAIKGNSDSEEMQRTATAGFYAGFVGQGLEYVQIISKADYQLSLLIVTQKGLNAAANPLTYVEYFRNFSPQEKLEAAKRTAKGAWKGEYDSALGRKTGAAILDYLLVAIGGALMKGESAACEVAESGSYSGTGEYGDVGGHHVHAKAGFKDDVNYDPKKGFSISQNFMRDNGLDHNIMTSKQRELFKELYESGRPNTLEEHTRIAREALKAGGASDSMIDDLINASLRNLREQGVTAPTRIPWYSK